MTKSGWWQVNFNLTLDGEEVGFDDLSECSQEYILRLIADGYRQGEIIEEVDEDEQYEPTEVWLCPFCADEYESEEEAKDCICHYKETMYKCPNCGEHFLESDVETEPQEIFTWYRVSSFLYDKLREYGEPVLDGPNGYYWGKRYIRSGHSS